MSLQTPMIGAAGSMDDPAWRQGYAIDTVETAVDWPGVSGAMAELLRQLAASRQVFCVTHQPLVAAAADHHFRVSKEVIQGSTHTRVAQLRDTAARQAELAELAGGDSGEAHSYAASLLGQRVA